MATPSLGAFLCSAEWRSSGNPGTTSATASESITSGDTVVVIANAYDNGVTVNVGAAAGAVNQFIKEKCVIFRLYYTATASTSIEVIGAWCWAAFKIANHTSTTSSGFAGHSWEDGALDKEPGGKVVSPVCYPLVESTFFIGGITLEGSKASERFESPGGILNLVGYDTNAPSAKHALHIFCGQTGACGAHQYEADIVGDHALDTSHYSIAIAYCASDPWSTCTLPGDGSSLVALPTSHARSFLVDCDLAYLATGQRLVALLPRVASKTFGQLWVIRYDDAWPPSPEPTQVLKDEDVIQCSLLVTPDGMATVFYLTNTNLHLIRYRVSTDSGETWGSEQTIDVGLTPESGTYDDAIVNALEHRTNAFVLKSGLVCFNSYIYGSSAPQFIILKQNGASGWAYVAKSTGVTARMMCPLQDGSVVFGSNRYIRNVQSDASYELVSTGSFTPVRGDVCPNSGVLSAVVTPFSGTSYQNANQRACLNLATYARDSSGFFEYIGGTQHETRLGASKLAKAIPIGGWQPSVGSNPVISTGGIAISSHAVRYRKDGTLEVLACNPDLNMQFFRARGLQKMGHANFEGRMH